MLVATNTAAETVIVTGERTEADVPNKIENVDADDAQVMINAVNTEDMMKYIPSIVVRKRHYGDTQDPLATRTSGVGASARSLLFVDGILISSPIGNNNSSASPHFGIAAPQDVSSPGCRLYGPFAARNMAAASIGAPCSTSPPKCRTIWKFMPTRWGRCRISANTPPGIPTAPGSFAGGIGEAATVASSWRLSANRLDRSASRWPIPP